MHRVPRSSKRGFFRAGYAAWRATRHGRGAHFLRFETGIGIEEVIEESSGYRYMRRDFRGSFFLEKDR